MAIAPLPGRKRDGPESAAEKFIEAAAPANAADKVKRRPAMIRFDAKLLARVDQAARRRGISRSAWISFTLSMALDEP